MLLKQYKLLIFDWDGTLMDSVAAIVESVQFAANTLGWTLPEVRQIREGIGLSFADQMQRLFPERIADSATFRKYYEQYFYDRVRSDKPTLFPGALDTLKTLRKRGYCLAVATSMGSQRLAQNLANSGIAELFDATRCADQTLPKPHPEMLFEILLELGIKPKRALMIGDTEYDLYMAQNAEMDSIGVTYGVHAPSRFTPYTPVACIDAITDLLALLE